jgi:hypothetical protein
MLAADPRPANIEPGDPEPRALVRLRPMTRKRVRFQAHNANTQRRQRKHCLKQRGKTPAANRTSNQIASKLATSLISILNVRTKIFFDVRRYLDRRAWPKRLCFPIFQGEPTAEEQLRAHDFPPAAGRVTEYATYAERPSRYLLRKCGHDQTIHHVAGLVPKTTRTS